MIRGSAALNHAKIQGQKSRGGNQMNKKASGLLFVAGATAMAISALMTPVEAKTPDEWTCSDFLQVPKNAQPQVVYWMEGFHKGAKPEAADVTVESFKRPIGKLVVECRKNKPQNLWDAIVQHFYTAAKAIP
ncbi:HdeA/HdeB family chaperone [Methylocapsa aurea]|uniref:HdeA/HdeB family chaperone n=1 Tax=Methylocapsa aurea TaxID=663610 RepID=UPI001FDA2106|nr:HdeA/HdeB family chaperone [Methylocapsa aurea]